MKVRDFIKNIGGATLCAKRLGISRQAIDRWYKVGIPMKHAYEIANKCAMSGVGFSEYNVKFISELETEKKR